MEVFKAKQAGRTPPPPPKKAKRGAAKEEPGDDLELGYLFIWYDELRSANNRGFKFEPISHAEIMEFSRGYRLDIEPFEIWTLRRLDIVWQNSLPKDPEA